MIKYDDFEMQMDSLAKYLHQDISQEILKKEYYPVLGRYDIKRFAEVVQWLKENYLKKQFPRIGDFNEGIKATTKHEEYKFEGRQPDPTEYSKDFQHIIWALKMMAEIEDSLHHRGNRDIYRNFIDDKMRKHEIYNSVTKKWAKHNTKRTFEPGVYFDPREFHPAKSYA